MLFDAILLICSMLAEGFITILKIIPFAVPTSWQIAIAQLAGYAGYFQGWLPMYPDPTASGLWKITGIMPLIGVFITAIVAMYMMKGGVMLFHLFSFGKIRLHLPTFGKGRTLGK